MELYKLLSILLCYPEQTLIDSLPDINQRLQQTDKNINMLTPLLTQLTSTDLITLQEDYVQTFDRSPTHALYLFEHLYGEDRMRGQAMVDLMQEYQSLGFELATEELPDYLPLFLEFLAICKPQKAQELLGSAIDIISHIGKKLTTNHSPYAGIFNVLEDLSPEKPQPLITPPVRDMDEALEQFGFTPEGLEPLLNNNNACMNCTTHQRG